MKSKDFIELEEQYGAHNYHPLDVVLVRGEGAWVWDAEGKKYLDCLAAYSALNHGHCHPRIRAALVGQAGQLPLTSRAFRNDQLPLFLRDLAALTGYEVTLPMNTGAEAVESALKAMRKWAWERRQIPRDQAEIIVCAGNFHGRTITIVSFSTEEQYRAGFGPHTPGFKIIPYGDVEALERAIGPHTCAFLVEPIQGEAGILMPPEGFLRRAEEVCRRHRILFAVDEIQTGFGRTGKLFAHQHENVRPDVLILGKALGGGYLPVSAVCATRDVLSVFRPGDHGSTFGGNPLAARVARAALEVLVDEKLVERSAELGAYFLERLRSLKSPDLVEVRGRGLFIGVELKGPARPYCEALERKGILCKETHERVIRFAPPLVITKEEIDWALERIFEVVEGKKEVST